MATEAATAPLPRLSYRVAEVAERTGIPRPSVYRLIEQGVIPKLSGLGDVVLVPAWALDAWAATNDWRHPDWRPIPPGNPEPDDGNTEQPAATVTPIRPDAS